MSAECLALDPERAATLTARLPELHRRAASAISSADVLLIVCGAGWSVPSGLKTYNDVASDYEDGTTYRDLCDPGLLARDDGGGGASPALKRRRLVGADNADAAPQKHQLFYGFWGGCYNAYQDAVPHAGYDRVLRWLARLRRTAACRPLCGSELQCMPSRAGRGKSAPRLTCSRKFHYAKSFC